MQTKISMAAAIAIIGIWLAVMTIVILSLPFAVLVFPLVIPVVSLWGAVIATRIILKHENPNQQIQE